MPLDALPTDLIAAMEAAFRACDAMTASRYRLAEVEAANEAVAAYDRLIAYYSAAFMDFGQCGPA